MDSAALLSDGTSSQMLSSITLSGVAEMILKEVFSFV